MGVFNIYDFKNCMYMYTDICMCVHVCAHAFGGQGTASSEAPQALFILGFSLAWDLLIQTGWLAGELPGAPLSPVPQLDHNIHHHGRLIVCVFGASSSGPHACMASSPSTEPYLQLLRGNSVRPVGFVSSSRHSASMRSVPFLDPVSF